MRARAAAAIVPETVGRFGRISEGATSPENGAALRSDQIGQFQSVPTALADSPKGSPARSGIEESLPALLALTKTLRAVLTSWRVAI